jgi:hypothetical protein
MIEAWDNLSTLQKHEFMDICFMYINCYMQILFGVPFEPDRTKKDEQEAQMPEETEEDFLSQSFAEEKR